MLARLGKLRLQNFNKLAMRAAPWACCCGSRRQGGDNQKGQRYLIVLPIASVGGLGARSQPLTMVTETGFERCIIGFVEAL